MNKKENERGKERENDIHMYAKAISHTYLSDATINIWGFTSRYLPLPHPMSKPIDPGSNFLRNLSTMGHGCKAPRFSDNCVHGRGGFYGKCQHLHAL